MMIPETWRWFKFRVFSGEFPGIVKCYVTNDNPEQEPMWVANYHTDLPETRTNAFKDVQDAMYRLADMLHITSPYHDEAQNH